MNNLEAINYLINCDFDFLLERIEKLQLCELNKIVEQEVIIKASLVSEIDNEDDLDILIYRLNKLFNKINDRIHELKIINLRNGLF